MIQIPESSIRKVHDLVQKVSHRIGTSQVKTASPSRSQGKIQVRVTWLDENGKRGIGYYSVPTATITKGSVIISVWDFVSCVFRVRTEISALVSELSTQVTRGPFFFDKKDTAGKLTGVLLDLLTQNRLLNKESPASHLCDAAVEKIYACVREGRHHSARSERMRKKGRTYLESALCFALKNGVTDDEIKEMVDMAFVRQIMDS